ncbi:MAG: sigma-70 family RNA polymerase sigma factor, partial [Cyanobacteria bacterium J06632_3]
MASSKSAQLRSRGMELLMQYKVDRSVKLRNQLVKLNAGLVRKIAHRVSHQCAEPYEDLEQIGYIGLIRSIERFDPGQGCAFSSFAVPYIRGEMLHFLRDRGTTVKIPRRWQDLQKEGQKRQAEL